MRKPWRYWAAYVALGVADLLATLAATLASAATRLTVWAHRAASTAADSVNQEPGGDQ